MPLGWGTSGTLKVNAGTCEGEQGLEKPMLIGVGIGKQPQQQKKSQQKTNLPSGLGLWHCEE